MASFHDIRFPEHISYGSSGGPQFSTTVMMLNSGFERRNINWSTVRAAYEAAHGIKTRAEMEEIIAFFYARMGRAYSFRFKDWADFELSAQVLGTGDGSTVDFQLIKTYQSGSWAYERLISKPVDGTLTNVSINAVNQVEDTDFTVDYATGIITFDTAPPDTQIVAVGSCEFDVHCRFDTDHLNVTHDMWETMSWPSIPLVEIKELVA